MPNEKSPKKRDKPAARASPLTEQEERIVRIPLSELHPFKGYPGLRDIMPRRQPYQVRDDDPIMQQIAATVKVRGVRQPGLVRPDPEGGYLHIQISPGGCRLPSLHRVCPAQMPRRNRLPLYRRARRGRCGRL